MSISLVVSARLDSCSDALLRGFAEQRISRKFIGSFLFDLTLNPSYTGQAICTKSKRICTKEVHDEGMHYHVHDPQVPRPHCQRRSLWQSCQSWRKVLLQAS